MKRCLATLMAAMLFIGTEAVAQAANWKLATGYKAELFHTQNLNEFAKEVQTSSGGQLIIEVVPDNRLARLNEIPKQVSSGAITAGEVIMSGLVKDLPAAGADSVPFMISSYDSARELWRHQRPVLEAALSRRGLMVLYAVPWPSQGLFTTKPVRNAGDLAGAKMRTYNATTVRIAEMLGATPVDVPTARVGQAFSEGLVDSMITSAVTGVDNKIWEHAKYFYDGRAWFPKNVVIVNRKAFNMLNQQTRDAVLRAAASAEERGWAMSERASKAAIAELARHNVQIQPVSYELRVELSRIGERFSLEWLRTTGKDASDILIPYYAGALQTR